MADPEAEPGMQFAGGSREEHAFPTLTPEMIARIAHHGRRRPVKAGEVLVEPGDPAPPLLVVTSGELRVTQPSGTGETLIVAHHPGQFSGEASILFGRRALARVRAAQDGEVIEVHRDQLLELVQADAEISEILMRAFILRRVELIAHGVSDVVLIGSTHSSGTLRVREFLTRNGHPYR
jgi:thioredoxin reductase (NADPH)